MSVNHKISSNYAQIADNLHHHRLNEYSQNGKLSPIQTLRRYRYNLELSSSLYEAFSIMEVALRNQIMKVWTQYFQHRFNAHFSGGLDEWPLDSRGIYFFITLKGHSPYDRKFKFHLEKIEREKEGVENDFEKANIKIKKLNSKKNPHDPYIPLRVVRNGDLVARLTFGTWKSCFEDKYNDINKWGLYRIFPNLTAYQTIDAHLDEIYDDLKTLNHLRNRFSHQEKIFHFKDLDSQFLLIEKYIKLINPDLLYLIDRNKFHRLWSQRARYF